jgi:hypothetical protein
VCVLARNFQKSHTHTQTHTTECTLFCAVGHIFVSVVCVASTGVLEPTSTCAPVFVVVEGDELIGLEFIEPLPVSILWELFWWRASIPCRRCDRGFKKI